MKVRELIKQLRKMPQNATVYCADHDHGEYEVNGCLRSVRLYDKQDVDEYDRQSDQFDNLPDEWARLGI